MKVYVAKILVENYYTKTTCNVKLSTDLEKLKKYCSNLIDAYADTNGGTVKEKSDLKYVMVAVGIKVTINIETHEV